MGLESGPKPGVSSTDQAKYDTYPYCGDTRRISESDTPDGVIIVTENLDTEGDSESSVFYYPEDLP